MKKLSIFLLFTVLCIAPFAMNTAQAEDAASEEDGAASVHFVELNPLILPVINENGVTQMVSLVVAVEVDSQEKADQVTKYSPRLTDAYLSDLYGAFSNQAHVNDVIPIVYLKKRLNIVSAKVLGDHVVSDVLVQVMQSRAT